MNVLILSHEWPPVTGGAGTALKGMIEGTQALRREYGVNFTLVVPSETSETFYRPELAPGVAALYLGVSKTLKGWRPPSAIRWCLAVRKVGLRPDLVHVWGAFPNAWLVPKVMPFVLTLHGSDVPGRNPDWRLRYLLCGRSYRRRWARASAITAVTTRLAGLAERFCGRKVDVVPNGVTLPPDQKRILHKPIRLLMVTRVAPLKNVDLGLDIARAMGGDVQLRIVGDGPDMYQYRGVRHANVEWTGWQADVEPHYRWADIFVNTASATGLGCSAIEAKAHRLPIVSRYCPGIAAEGGIMTAPPHGRDMAAAVRRTAAAYHEAVSQTDIGRNELGWENRARPYFELYRKVYSDINSYR